MAEKYYEPETFLCAECGFIFGHGQHTEEKVTCLKCGAVIRESFRQTYRISETMAFCGNCGRSYGVSMNHKETGTCPLCGGEDGG